ncbi:MAG TPA: VCBS repeat-containing protein [Ohtaekwangia sp.]|nr:VCBS repeat-containing protein [Ohtaekwangia sp.]
MVKISCRIILGFVVSSFFIFGCSEKEKDDKLFKLVSSSHSGIEFQNSIIETDSFNVLNFEYIYNGAGVGVGDVNGDGLIDLYFGGNMVSSKLYLNKGDFVFEDITDKANVSTADWCTGIAMIDINQDGKLDVHVSTITPKLNGHSENLFFINQGNDENGVPVFREMAHQLGVADTSYSTQSAFFDYDLDGDLDMYLLTNANELFVRSNPIGQRHDGSGKSVDKLYQNIGNDSLGNPSFKDVSREAGILSEGWGLGVVISDLTQDGYPDVYVANDFMSNDHFYINNQNGTFSEQSGQRLKHQEMNGMGVDIADLNNDGLNDIVVVDMLPEDNLRQKTMFSDLSYDRFQLALQRKYEPQYVRNVLQLNNGNGTFSDIGYYAGIHATDWSWSPLIADFDNDGWKDIFITNGYVRDVTDLDFGVYAKDVGMFGTKDARRQKLIEGANKLQGINKPNLLFRNNKDLTFTNTAEDWGLAEPSYSNGSAYADLDNDGDLDIVINNLNSKAFLFENRCVTSDSTRGEHNFLRIDLIGTQGNREGIGATVSIYYNGISQFVENTPQRGFKSNVEQSLHFGLANIAAIDSLIVKWPGFKSQKITNVKVNQVLALREDDATESSLQTVRHSSIFNQADLEEMGITFSHQENNFIDFKVTATLPRKHSQQGPAICTGDVNGDELVDFIVGGSAHRPAVGFIQTREGKFRRFELPKKTEEDIGLLLFDADGDNDLDLYCVSGSSELGKDDENYKDRIYLNNGNGQFNRTAESIPETKSSGSCVIGQDFDRDGDIDLFVGGRVKPGSYLLAPESYILQNNGKGVFTDVTENMAPQIRNIGMVTSALWTDYNNDGWIDMLVVGEFMPVTFFKNVNGKQFINDTELTIKNSSGWWNSIAGGDIDNDGDTDYVIGNVGLNSTFKASIHEPVSVYAKDFDDNGSVDPILSRYIGGNEYPVHPRETLTAQIVGFKKKLRSYEIYGKTFLKDLLTAEMIQDAYILRATEFRSSLLENLGNNQFALRPLPGPAQYAPVCGILLRDINKDHNLDIISIGNDYSAEPLSGYYDAGIGNCLLGDGKGNFKSLDVTFSGFSVDGDAKALVSLPVKNKELFLATQNQDDIVAFLYASKREGSFIKLKQSDLYAEFHFTNGAKRKVEFYFGESYLSQSPRTVSIPEGVDKIVVFDSMGGRRTLSINDNLSNNNLSNSVSTKSHALGFLDNH